MTLTAASRATRVSVRAEAQKRGAAAAAVPRRALLLRSAGAALLAAAAAAARPAEARDYQEALKA